jgi:hypothetical protein
MATWDWTLDGVPFGGTTDINVAEVEGWLDLPDVRIGDSPRAGQHGLTMGEDFAAGRTIRFVIETVAADADAAATIVEALRDKLVFVAGDDGDIPLVGTTPGYPALRTLVRPRRRNNPLTWDSGIGAIRAVIEMIAADPRLYADTASSDSTALSTAVGGLDFSAVAPFVFGSGGTGNTMDCPNDGTFPTPWVATFTGPLTAPELVHVDSGYRITLSGGTLLAGETLVVDSLEHTILLGGTASRYSWLAASSQWFDLAPGANSIMLLGASGSGSVSMAWRSAWI